MIRWKRHGDDGDGPRFTTGALGLELTVAHWELEDDGLSGWWWIICDDDDRAWQEKRVYQSADSAKRAGLRALSKVLQRRAAAIQRVAERIGDAAR